MQRLVWLEDARADLRAILTYISERDAQAAQRLNDAIGAAAERIAQFPYMYRHGRVPNTREAVVHPNYIVIYRVTADAAEIVSIVHSRQQYP